MHRRRHHPQHRRRAPCTDEPPRTPREADRAPAGPYIDLSDPAAPKLVGNLPEEFQEFGRILLQRAADAARERDGQPSKSPAAQPPALPETLSHSSSYELEETPKAAAAAETPKAAAETPKAPRAIAPEVAAATGELSALIGAGQYRTRAENRVEIARLTAGNATEDAERPVQYEVRHNWLGRPERWYTAEEVSHHRTPTDLWLISHGKVYDVTKWVEVHPGGAAALLRRGGLDATRDFDFHTKRARGLWEATYIGKLDDGRPADWSGWFMS